MLRSMPCRAEHFDSDWYARQAAVFGFPPGVSLAIPSSYRKAWEWCAILQVLEEREMLAPGRNGIGFAVGREPLPSVFAARSVDILATDLAADRAADLWVSTGQHADGLEGLFRSDLVDEELFRRHVRFAPADMADLRDSPSDSCDFVWSSCAIEHLGTLAAGMDFLKSAMRLVRPGGVAVHTTEFNCSSNGATLFTGDNVVYRRRDIEQLDLELRPMRCGLIAPEFDTGTHPYDLDYDEPPFLKGKAPHIKLLLGDFVATSYLLIAVKAK